MSLSQEWETGRGSDAATSQSGLRLNTGALFSSFSLFLRQGTESCCVRFAGRRWEEPMGLAGSVTGFFGMRRRTHEAAHYRLGVAEAGSVDARYDLATVGSG